MAHEPLKRTISQSTRMSYRIGRGEQGVLTFEPYKSYLLPLWRFRTVPVARKSAQDLWHKFEEFDEEDDFVGMDMTRKFIQMGYTRSKRYANHAGGRKYKRSDGEKERKQELPRSEDHKGKKEKEAAAEVFREYWDKCKAHEGYQLKKEAFQKEQKDWHKANPPEDS
ncbi:hypothetical protein NLU13_7602 [Sarocladium strictum]|uniref:Cytoplasmic protein n=1 Tax=Sarocladium strictum TaxID=5046 RepID=A0AA39GDT7_SARSR|nr:hypothetical protein NLU13_7602 [Sarocladium strictum]